MTKEEKCRNTQINRIVIHLNDDEKRIYKEDLDLYIKEGWEVGYSDKHRKTQSEKHLNKIPWNKNESCAEETKLKISKTLKDKYSNNELKVWSKGLTKETNESLKHSSEKQLGKPGSNLGKKFTEEHKQKISKAHKGKHKLLSKEKLQIKLSKEYITRKLHNSFNTSKPEEEFYKKLLEENKNKTIYRRCKDVDRYPFYCDFYIEEDDLFIELNLHWTHGGKPFDENDKECIKQLNEWQEKAKTSQFYKNAIETWTVRDVKKLETAKQNKLNYKTIY